MADLALAFDPLELVADLSVASNDLVQEDSLRTAVMLSLFVDRRAETGDTLPAGETDRRGWWADAVPVIPGDAIGSRLWLVDREKATTTVRSRVERYAREALQWLLDDRVADRIEVAAEFPQAGWWVLTIQIFRPAADPVRYQFDGSWSASSSPPALDAAPESGVVTSSDAYAVTGTGTYLTSE